MENTENNCPSNYSRNKLIVIIISVVLQIVTSPMPLIFGEVSSAAKLINFLTIIGLNLLTFAWCYYDSLERGQSLGGWGILLFLFGVFYLFRSRGLKRGLMAIGKGFLIFLVMVIGTLIATFITILALGINS